MSLIKKKNVSVVRETIITEPTVIYFIGCYQSYKYEHRFSCSGLNRLNWLHSEWLARDVIDMVFERTHISQLYTLIFRTCYLINILSAQTKRYWEPFFTNRKKSTFIYIKTAAIPVTTAPKHVYHLAAQPGLF